MSLCLVSKLVSILFVCLSLCIAFLINLVYLRYHLSPTYLFRLVAYIRGGIYLSLYLCLPVFSVFSPSLSPIHYCVPFRLFTLIIHFTFVYIEESICLSISLSSCFLCFLSIFITYLSVCSLSFIYSYHSLYRCSNNLYLS